MNEFPFPVKEKLEASQSKNLTPSVSYDTVQVWGAPVGSELPCPPASGSAQVVSVVLTLWHMQWEKITPSELGLRKKERRGI